jgi:acyl-coenzyme A synthetase/AMP-(fatty) acid ligase
MADTGRSIAGVLFQFTAAISAGMTIDLEDSAIAAEGASLDMTNLAGGDRQGSPIDWAGMLRANGAVRIGLRTSGTISRGTLVRHPLANLVRAVIVHPRHADDVWGLAYNPTHIAGVQVYLQALANRNTIVNLWGIAPSAIIQRCQQWGVTHLSATPTFYRLLAAERAVLPGVKSVTSGGEPLDETLLEAIRDVFPHARVHNIYALTETGTLLTSDGAEFTIPAERQAEIKIADGRIWVRRNWLGEFDGAAEWFDTKDVVVVSPSDPTRFQIVGRESRAVNIGGEKVNAQEVEAVLASHPDVAVARVFGRANSVTGQVLVAEIVVKHGSPSESELRQHVASRLPPVKVPRFIRFVDQLQLTRTGKLAHRDQDAR